LSSPQNEKDEKRLIEEEEVVLLLTTGLLVEWFDNYPAGQLPFLIRWRASYSQEPPTPSVVARERCISTL
jgi:hypothetical protein